MANALLRCAMLLAFSCVSLGALAHASSMPHNELFNKQELNPKCTRAPGRSVEELLR
jgi:hypothetical protein